MTLRYGLIGAGMMGQEHIRNIALIPEATVAAIVEPDAAQRAIALGLAPGARVCPTLEALLGEDIDALVIASPNFLHAAQLEAIFAARRLPVLVEKPLFTRPEDAARLAALDGAPVWVAMEYRYMPPIAALIREAEAATGGIRMLTIREHRYPFLEKVGDWNRFNRYSGGTLVEKCCHFFDLMRLILADEPVRVMASGGQAVNHLGERYDGETPDIWDHAYVIVDFSRGARAMLELSMFAEGGRFQEAISAVGPAGKIEALIPGPTRFWPQHLGAPPTAEIIVSPREPRGPRHAEVPVPAELLAAGDHNGATYFQHIGFADMVRTGRAPDVSLRDGAMAVLTGLAAQQSAERGEAVTVAGWHAPATAGAA